jgi:enoyl-CoA hydratase/carnithine racemase
MGLVQVSDEGPVRTVRMNRPDKKNALTFEMYDAMAAGFAGAQENPELRCILLAGSPHDFCAGNDIGNFAQTATSADAALRKPVINFLHAIAQSDKPVVAAVQGNAVGIGATMLLHCDHVVASTHARFSMPFVSLGILPEAASTLIVPRLMGHARAFELLVMGRPLDAAAARDGGLINTVVSSEAVESEAMKAAEAIAALPPQGVLTARRLMRGERSEIIERMDHEATLIGDRLKSAEARSAFEAFLNRKKA